jgi:putative CocE/NonD family hydrolase
MRRSTCTFATISSLIAAFFLGNVSSGQSDERAEFIRANYTKDELRIRMRDGVELFTAIYTPNDLDPAKKYPVMLFRTPYSVGPYGLNTYPGRLGPCADFERNKYIFVMQDVRGRYMSQGEFVNMRPHIRNKNRNDQIDESSDTYDTIDWVIKNVPRHNGRVGQWGISYPGFYTSAGAIDSHPALVAVSPQAPIADWFFDDFHRNGAFVLPMAFNFFASFGKARPQPTTESPPSVEIPTRDGYQFFLDLGPLKQVDQKYFKNDIGFWNDLEAHPNYDSFWQARNILPHLKGIQASVLTVGGWYDTEDLYGPLATYATIEKQNPGIRNSLVMGPWYHGQWAGDEGKRLGQAEFGFATSTWYQQQVLLPFFESHLRGTGAPLPPEATVFDTGSDRWRQFDSWPPANVRSTPYFLAANSKLTTAKEAIGEGSDSFPSDPRKPVPYTTEITSDWARNYVTEDQRFASWRPDVLVYRSDVISEPVTVAGSIPVELWVTSTQTDADWIVKIIDEFPGTPVAGRRRGETADNSLSGRQELVRAGVLRGRFRESFENPVAMTPQQPTRIRLELNDVFHTFQRGHRIMIHVQSTWFPFIDRNPQKFVPNIFEADEGDFQAAIHSVLRNPSQPSMLRLPILP